MQSIGQWTHTPTGFTSDVYSFLFCPLVILDEFFKINILKMAKAISKRTFQVNDIVFAKIRGFPDWPSLIKKIDGNIVTVQFFSELKEVYV